jgi:hypothetical protein
VDHSTPLTCRELEPEWVSFRELPQFEIFLRELMGREFFQNAVALRYYGSSSVD